jgi:glycosyltransferase involved in cell wall biosynthesis
MNSANPLVSVICLCYNHERYVVDAIESVLSQTYDNIELIIVDDASTDNSLQIIKDRLLSFPEAKFIPLTKNVGNCRAFNIGWQASSGTYIIDLAADDLLYPKRISIGVECFIDSGPDFGVHFTDAQLIDKSSIITGAHETNNFFTNEVPQGIIFRSLLSKYFINPVTMMYSKDLLDYLGGYDESLAYEDFDLWVRSSKKFKYCYSNKMLVAKRALNQSHGGSQYRPVSKILFSTYKVCEKAYSLCEDKGDFSALLKRINYELKMAVFSFNWLVANNLFKLRREVIKKINAVVS